MRTTQKAEGTNTTHRPLRSRPRQWRGRVRNTRRRKTQLPILCDKGCSRPEGERALDGATKQRSPPELPDHSGTRHRRHCQPLKYDHSASRIPNLQSLLEGELSRIVQCPYSCSSCFTTQSVAFGFCLTLRNFGIQVSQLVWISHDSRVTKHFRHRQLPSAPSRR